MEYFDLNIRPIELSYIDRLASVCNLINNAIKQYHNQEYATKLIVDYDEATSTLRIKDDGSGITLSDFVQKENDEGNWFTSGLRSAISLLLGSQITPIFKSNFGTFTPIIRNKEGLSQNIASIFIAYQPREPRVSQWIDLKFAGNEQTSNANHGTEIAISPLDADFIADLKYHFSFLLPWSQAIPTYYGTLLINPDYINNIYVDGENITLEEEPEKDEDALTFSYDIDSQAFDRDVIPNRYKNIAKYAFKCIKKIYEELSDETKELVFNKLLNNHSSVEWNSPLIRNYIIKYFAKSNPGKYLIGQWEQENANFVAFAKQAGKEIIWVKDEDEYNEVINLGIESVESFGLHYVAQNLTNFVEVEKLNDKERTNWQALQAFLTYFVNSNKEIQDQLAKNKLDHYSIKILENLPSTQSFYMFNQKAGVIDRKILSYKFSALLSGCRFIVFVPTGEITPAKFNQLWFDSIANYIIACKQENHKDNHLN